MDGVGSQLERKALLIHSFDKAISFFVINLKSSSYYPEALILKQYTVFHIHSCRFALFVVSKKLFSSTIRPAIHVR